MTLHSCADILNYLSYVFSLSTWIYSDVSNLLERAIYFSFISPFSLIENPFIVFALCLGTLPAAQGRKQLASSSSVPQLHFSGLIDHGAYDEPLPTPACNEGTGCKEAISSISLAVALRFEPHLFEWKPSSLSVIPIWVHNILRWLLFCHNVAE